MKNPIEEILQELGWSSDSFKIPVANEENKELEEQIERKTQLKAKLKSELECFENLIKTGEENVARFEKEREENEKLITACSARIEMEKNLYSLAQSAESKITREIHEFVKERKETIRKAEILEKDMFKLKKKIQTAKQKIKQKHNYLLRYEEEINEKEKCGQLIEEITKLDDKKFKDNERERIKNREDLETLRHLIIKTIDEIHEREIVLDNTTKLHVETLAEHLELLRQWTQSIDVSKQRDKDIQETLKEMNTLHKVSEDKKQELQEADNSLKYQVLDNSALDIDTKQLENNLMHLKNEYQKFTEFNNACDTEINIRKKVIRNLTRDTENNRDNGKRIVLGIEKKHNKFDELNKKVCEMKSKLGDISNRKMDVSYKTQQLENTLQNELKKEESMIQAVKRCQNQGLTSSNRITDLEGELKVINSQESSEIKKTENLDILLSKYETVLREKKEDENNWSMEINKCEKELQRIIGNDNDNDRNERKKNRIEELNAIYSHKFNESKRLYTQITILENDMQQLSNCLASGNEQLTRIKIKKHDLALIMEGSEKHLKTAQMSNEEKQMEENILRLRVTQADKLLSKIDDKVYDLEKYKIEIEALMQERRTDIAIQKESLTIEKRLYSNELSELNNTIIERKTRIQQLQTRYHNYIATFGTEQDGETTLNCTYLKIQSAQEKFFLKEQGDHLDQAIRRCECEIESMENTLKIVNACNNKYKSNLALVDDEGPEKAERNNLSEEIYKYMDKIKQRKRQLQEKRQNLEKMEHDYQRLLKDIDEIKEEKESKHECTINLDKQILEQHNKIIRADKSIKKVLKGIKNMCTCNTDNTIPMQEVVNENEKDIALRELDEVNSLALQRITEFMIRHIEAEMYVKKLLTEKSIALPSAYHCKPSPSSSRCGSSTNSAIESQNRNANYSKLPSSRGSVSSVINIKPPW